MDMLSYIVVNPASITFHAVTSTAKVVGDYLKPSKSAEIKMSITPLWKLAASTGPYMKLAGLSGALAVALGAYEAHAPSLKKGPEQARAFEAATRYHFIHTLALLSLPLCRYPPVTAAFFIGGIIMFCGTCYYDAFTNDKRFSKITKYGGTCFILGWLTFLM